MERLDNAVTQFRRMVSRGAIGIAAFLDVGVNLLDPIVVQLEAHINMRPFRMFTKFQNFDSFSA